MGQASGYRYLARIGLVASLQILACNAAVAKDTKKQVEFFLGTCFGSLDDVSRVKSLAALLKWPKAPPDFANLAKPVTGKDYLSWIVRKDGEFYAVAVNQSPWSDKQTANVCSVVIQSPRDAVIAELTRVLKLKKVHEEHEPLQTTYFYEYDSSVVERAMVTVIALDNGTSPVSLAVTGIRNYP